MACLGTYKELSVAGTKGQKDTEMISTQGQSHEEFALSLSAQVCAAVTDLGGIRILDPVFQTGLYHISTPND